MLLVIIIIIIIITIIMIIIILPYYYYPCYHLHARYNDNYITETNHVSRLCSFAAVVYLHFVLHVLLFCPWNMFCTFTLALSAVYVRCPVGLFFFISLISCFPGVLLSNCLSDFELVPVAPILTGITFAFTFHMR